MLLTLVEILLIGLVAIVLWLQDAGMAGVFYAVMAMALINLAIEIGRLFNPSWLPVLLHIDDATIRTEGWDHPWDISQAKRFYINQLGELIIAAPNGPIQRRPLPLEPKYNNVPINELAMLLVSRGMREDEALAYG
ncbi:MAG: hypothetical protein EA402_01270 [Planctomycetota bacterium]|nr:MAG: hypothetical protein EA402_01270 [Planctomycetota bacterium]